jgi:hypothetical protein
LRSQEAEETERQENLNEDSSATQILWSISLKLQDLVFSITQHHTEAEDTEEMIKDINNKCSDVIESEGYTAHLHLTDNSDRNASDSSNSD